VIETAPRFRIAHRGPLAAVGEWRCPGHAEGEGPPECASRHLVVFTRSGAFRRTAGGRSVVADPATVLFFPRGQEYRVGHPVPGGDRCVVLALAGGLLDEVAWGAAGRRGAGRSGASPFPAPAAPVDAGAALELRRLLAAAGRDPLEADERALHLAGRALRAAAAAVRGASVRGGPERPATAALHARVVERARLCAAGRFRERLTLSDLGRAAAASPWHLCRLFRRATGMSIHRHVNRLRLLAGLDLLAPGADLSAIALEVGFSSHSHFTTAFRREFGATPSRAARLLTPAAARRMRTILKAPAPPPA
jgi:AraC-like DNA-binding protein